MEDIKTLAERVETEWRDWMSVPDIIPTGEMLTALDNLLMTILEREIDIDPKEGD